MYMGKGVLLLIKKIIKNKGLTHLYYFFISHTNNLTLIFFSVFIVLRHALYHSFLLRLLGSSEI